jgi:hypothetical protein
MEELMKDTPAPTMDDTPTPLPPDVMEPSEPPSRHEELPLHLRVLRAIVEGQADQERVDRALELAHEIYELETSKVALADYRSAS